MQLVMDGLLVAAAVFAGTYCYVLSRRVQALKDLDSGLGGAITRLTRALEDARRALEEAKAASGAGRAELKDLVNRADAAAGQLRILLAASKDLAPPPAGATARPPHRPEPSMGDDAQAAPRPAPEREPQETPPKPRPLAPASPEGSPLRHDRARGERPRREAALLAALASGPKAER